MMRLTVAALVGIFAFSGTLLGQAPTSQPSPTEQSRERLEAILKQLQARQLLPTPETPERKEAAARLQEEQRLRLTALAGLNQCALPDGTTHPVNKTVTFLGWRYLCVEVLDASLVRQGVGWTRLTD